GRLLVGSFVGILFLIGYGYVTKVDVFPSRLITFYALLLAFLFLLLFRTLARAIRRSLFSFGIGVNNVLIVGNTRVTEELIESVADVKATGYRVVGIVGGNKKHSQYHYFSSFGAAVSALEKRGIHSIIQTELYPDPSKNGEILAFAQENHVAYRF